MKPRVYDPRRFAPLVANGILAGLALWGLLVLMFFSLYGCSAGRKFTAEEPLHAESGAGVTIWKVPLAGIGSWGGGFGYYGRGVPGVIINEYSYQAKPPSGLAAAPGAPPSLPSHVQEGETKEEGRAEPKVVPGPAPVDYQTIYRNPATSWDLVVFRNRSWYRVHLWIAGAPQPIILDVFGATADMHFEEGEWQLRAVIEKPADIDPTATVERFGTLHIHREGRGKIVGISEYGFQFRNWGYGGYYGGYGGYGGFGGYGY